MNIPDDQLAAALIAQMAGSELKKVDNSTVTQSSTGPATRIDPKKFLTGLHQHQQNQQAAQQAAMTAQLNRQAEMMHPLPGQPLIQTTTTPSSPQQPQSDPNQLTFDFLDEATAKKSLKQLDLIVDYLYSINNKLDKLDKVLSKRRD